MEPSVYLARASLKSNTVVFLDRNALSGTLGALLAITWNSEQFCATMLSVCLGWPGISLISAFLTWYSSYMGI